MRPRAILFTLLLLASSAAAARAQSPLSQQALPTTDGDIAVGNLSAQLEGEERLGRKHPLTLTQEAGIADLLETRGQFLGRISDYERAADIGERLVAASPTDGRAYLTRARSRATFHRFREALADLDRAEQLGVTEKHTRAPRAAILQALGRYEEADRLRQAALAQRRDIRTLTAAATLASERGDITTAEALFVEAQHHYRDVSPFPVAWLYFQQGQMWMREGDLDRAATLFTAALERLPQYATAQGHFAEVLAAQGKHERALALLLPLAESSDDPDYAAQLARILGESGRGEEARPWRAIAARRYDDLTARHPEAFADHAAEFWLAAGEDPAKGLAFARRNVELRPTARAYELLLQTSLAVGSREVACSAAGHVRALPHLWPALRSLSDQGSAVCG